MSFSKDFDTLKEQFSSLELISEDNSFEKIRVDANDITELLNTLKNDAAFDFNMLSTFIAVDLNDNFELIYDLYSTNANKFCRVSVLVDKNYPKAPTAVDVFKSAHFDECEIFDLFGVEFTGNKKLKRLFMPQGWIGHPLRKDYVFEDKRLDWNLEEKS